VKKDILFIQSCAYSFLE